VGGRHFEARKKMRVKETGELRLRWLSKKSGAQRSRQKVGEKGGVWRHPWTPVGGGSSCAVVKRGRGVSGLCFSSEREKAPSKTRTDKVRREKYFQELKGMDIKSEDEKKGRKKSYETPHFHPSGQKKKRRGGFTCEECGEGNLKRHVCRPGDNQEPV